MSSVRMTTKVLRVQYTMAPSLTCGNTFACLVGRVSLQVALGTKSSTGRGQWRIRYHCASLQTWHSHACPKHMTQVSHVTITCSSKIFPPLLKVLCELSAVHKLQRQQYGIGNRSSHQYRRAPRAHPPPTPAQRCASKPAGEQAVDKHDHKVQEAAEAAVLRVHTIDPRWYSSTVACSASSFANPYIQARELESKSSKTRF